MPFRGTASGSVMRMHEKRARKSLHKGTPVRGCTLMRLRVRTRVLLFLGLAIVIGTNEPGPGGKTLAYFTATATTTANTISTVTLAMTAPSASGLFNIGSNMIPGDYQLKPIDVVNGGTSGVTQQDFTYSIVNTNTATGNHCSSSTPPSPAPPLTRLARPIPAAPRSCSCAAPAMPLGRRRLRAPQRTCT